MQDLQDLMKTENKSLNDDLTKKVFEESEVDSWSLWSWKLKFKDEKYYTGKQINYLS